MSKQKKINRVISEERLEDAFNFDGRYNKKCDQLAYDVLADGGTYAMIAKEAKVSLRTVEYWKQPGNPRYRESFAEACLLGRAANVAWFDEIEKKNLVHANKHFNPVLLISARKRRFNESEQRVVPLPEVAGKEGYKEKAKAIFDEGVAGNLSPDEVQKYTASLANMAKLIELETLIEDVKKLKEAQIAKS